MVYGLYNVEWGGRQKDQESESGEQGTPSKDRCLGNHRRERSARRAEYPIKEKEGDSEDVLGEDMDIEDETESRKKLDEQKKKPQKESRDVERLSLISKEAQESVKECLQDQLQEVEKGRHDLMPEHQKVQKKP